MCAAKNIKGIIFDLDGTLCDTFPVIIEAFNAAVAPIKGRTYTGQQVIALFGDPEPVMIRREVGDRWEEACEVYYEHYQREHHQIAPFDGVSEMLAELKGMGVPMGVVTGKSRRSCDITLREMGWADCFRSIVTGSEMTRQKPDPEGVLTAARQMGVDRASCIMVGDSPADIGAAKAAGIAAVVAGWHSVYLHELTKLEPEFWAGTPEDVVKLIGDGVIDD
jgi:HAD superfamily hydrolase (TIGR01509 family)